MKITPQRGAIPVTVGDPPRVRTLFFPMLATAALVDQYGIGFLGALYKVVPDPADPKKTKLELKSMDALRFFLWAGLQEELADTGETLSENEAGEFLRPWTMMTIFNAVVMAVTGATATPALPGKNEAPEPAKASQVVAFKKPSTSTRRKGSTAAL